MNKRDFPGYDTWCLAKMNGDHALAFVAVQGRQDGARPRFHLVQGLSYFRVMSKALAAAQQALAQIIRIDKHGNPIFSSPYT